MRSNERGFTLVEVLIAMVIMSVGLVAVAQLMAVSMQSHRLGRLTAEASLLASVKIEELVKMNFTTDPEVQITGAATLDANTANYFDTTANGFTRRWNVTAGPTADTRRLTLRVIPPPSSQPFSKQIDVTTIIRQW